MIDLRVALWRLERAWALFPLRRFVGGLVLGAGALSCFCSGAGASYPLLGALALIAGIFLLVLGWAIWSIE